MCGEAEVPAPGVEEPAAEDAAEVEPVFEEEDESTFEQSLAEDKAYLRGEFYKRHNKLRELAGRYGELFASEGNSWTRKLLEDEERCVLKLSDIQHQHKLGNHPVRLNVEALTKEDIYAVIHDTPFKRCLLTQKMPLPEKCLGCPLRQNGKTNGIPYFIKLGFV